MKKFIALKENVSGNNFLKIETRYNLGGYNVFTYKPEARGYYLSVSPVKRFDLNGVAMESYTAFSGVKVCVLEVTRQSKKAAERAEALAAEKEAELIEYLCKKYNLEVLTGE
jgi:hypothetical protein